MEERNEATANRVRMNVTTTAKGIFTLDVTVESTAVDEARKLLKEALRQASEVAVEAGYSSAPSA